MEELTARAFKSYDCDDEDCVSNGTTNAVETTIVNNVQPIQEKLLCMERDYVKRMKIQEICYKKKLNHLQKNIMDLKRQMDVSVVISFQMLSFYVKLNFILKLFVNFLRKISILF